MKLFTKYIIIRKLLHIGTAFFPIGYIFIPRFPMLIGLFTLALTFLVLDFLRLKIKSLGDLFYHYCGKGLWDKEKYTLTSATHYAVAAFLSVYLFDKWIAIAALLFLSFGDTAAHVIGVKYGKVRIDSGKSDKTIEGSLACMVI